MQSVLSWIVFSLGKLSLIKVWKDTLERFEVPSSKIDHCGYDVKKRKIREK